MLDFFLKLVRISGNKCCLICKRFSYQAVNNDFKTCYQLF
jgi:hypothetical protein